MITKWEVYDALDTEFYNALPQTAHDCDVSINEANWDKFTKEYDRFHEVEKEEFNIDKLELEKSEHHNCEKEYCCHKCKSCKPSCEDSQ